MNSREENEFLKNVLKDIRTYAQQEYHKTKNRKLFVIQDMVSEAFDILEGKEI